MQLRVNKISLNANTKLAVLFKEIITITREVAVSDMKECKYQREYV